MKHAEPSQRQLRVGEQLRHVIAEVLQRESFDDPALSNAGLVSVNEVRPSPDLKHATAYVTVLGGGDLTPVLDALNDAAHQIQGEVGRKISMKFTPRLKFREDTSFGYANRIDELLHSDRVAKDLAKEDSDGTA